MLNESMEKTILEHERSQTRSARSRASMVQKKTTKKKTVQRPAWNVGAAAEIESTSLQQSAQAEVSTVSMSLSRTGPKKKGGKSKVKRAASPPGAAGERRSVFMTMIVALEWVFHIILVLDISVSLLPTARS